MKFALDEDVLSVVCDGRSIQLLPKEFQLLQFLCEHPGRTFTRSALLDAVWTMESPVDRTVDDHVYRLRKKLAFARIPAAIATVRGHGYRLDLEPTPAVGSSDAERQAPIQPQSNHPLLRDPDYRRHIRELFRTYVLHGQGQGIRAMMQSPDVFGIELDSTLSIHARFVSGDFRSVLEEESLPLSEWLFWLLGLYKHIQFNYTSTLHFMEEAVAHYVLRTEHHLETITFDLGRLYLFTGQTERALCAMADSVAACDAMPTFLDGYIPLIRIEDALFSLYTGDIASARDKLGVAQRTLQQLPWQREQAFFQIVQGFLLWVDGDAVLAEQRMDEGLEMLRNLGIVHHLVGRLHEILYFLDHIKPHQRLQHKYRQMWAALSKQYDFPWLTTTDHALLTDILDHDLSVSLES